MRKPLAHKDTLLQRFLGNRLFSVRLSHSSTSRGFVTRIHTYAISIRLYTSRVASRQCILLFHTRAHRRHKISNVCEEIYKRTCICVCIYKLWLYALLSLSHTPMIRYGDLLSPESKRRFRRASICIIGILQFIALRWLFAVYLSGILIWKCCCLRFSHVIAYS